MPKYNGPYNPKNPVPDGEASIVIYGYVPSLALALVALVTFGIALVAHLWYLLRARGTRTFQFLLCFGCAMELVGYGFRVASHYHPFVVIDFVIQYFMIVCAPVFFAAALYLSLSIAVRRAEIPDILPLRPKLLVTLFVIIDVVTTALQVLGAAFIGVSESDNAQGKKAFITTESANNILLSGLAVQCFSFLIFLVILGLTAVKSQKRTHHQQIHEEKQAGSTETPPALRYPPREFFIVLGLSSLAIWLRTLFRLAETAQGVFGYASTHEYLFGILEYTPVIVALGIWAARPLHKLVSP